MDKISVDRQRIVDDLRSNLGVKDGDIIGVHSSLKSIGVVEGGPDTFIEALIEAVGGVEKGTVVMPCFNNPLDVVDLRTTPCRLGLVPETFRTFPGVMRSVNQTHSVAAIGKDAKTIVDCHEGKTPLGVGSPFHQLAKMGGDIIHIGCDMSTCSLIHVAECVVKSPYLHIAYSGYDKVIKVITEDGREIDFEPRENPGCSRNFTVVQDEMDKRGLLLKGMVGMAESIKAAGADILATTVDLLEADPAALLCECPVCAKRRRAIKSKG